MDKFHIALLYYIFFEITILSFLFTIFSQNLPTCKVKFHPSVEFNPAKIHTSKMEFNSSYFSFIILHTNMVLPPSGKEIIMNKQKHLNLEARILIETLLNEHHSFKSIARELGKDCTTIS